MGVAENNTVKFTVKYNGPALASRRMDARDLAPAMLSTAKLVEHTAAMLYGSDQDLKIDVNAEFEGGSFMYEMVAGFVMVGGVLFSNLSISDVLTTATTILDAIKQGRGKKPQAFQPGPQPNQTTIHYTDNSTHNVNLNVTLVERAYQNPTLRRDIEGAVEPLKKPGIEEFELTTPFQRVEVTRDEVGYLDAPKLEELELQDKVVEEIIEVVAPDFREGNKWQVGLAGEGVVWTAIEDKNFIRQVMNHEVTFGRGDFFRVSMRVRVVRRPTGKLDRERTIVQVHGPLEGGKQMNLF